jgi:hypothetical protein
MLDAKEYDRLPDVFKEIVDHDRDNPPIRDKVVSFRLVQDFRVRRSMRRQLSRMAEVFIQARLKG